MQGYPHREPLGVVAGLIAGCSSVPNPSPGASATTGPAAATTLSGLKRIDQSALQAMLDKTAKELILPGAVILLRTPQGEFTITYGTTQLGTTIPPGDTTYFRIASNTKTMTAALILQLAQENKLTLNDPVSKYVPRVPNGDKITIAELLEMRSGLYNYSNAPEISASMDQHPAKVWIPSQLLAIAFTHPPTSSPGVAYEYNNTNYVLLGLIIEKVGGKPLAQAMRDRLFEPLHLEHTLLPPSAVNTLPVPYSHGYLYGSASVAMVGTPPYSPQVQAAARAGKLQPNDFTNLNHSFAAAAGGVISTAADVATWIQALVTGRVLNTEYQRRWIDSPKPEDPSKPDGQQYGYGIAKLHWGSNTMYFHGGETPGFNSFIGCDPGNDVTLVIWTNLTVSLDELATANALMLKVLDQIYVVSPLLPPQTSLAGVTVTDCSCCAETLPFASTSRVRSVAVPHPHLWQGMEGPYLYRLVVELSNKSSQLVDRVSLPFGIRQVRFDPDQGLFLNGKHVAVHGVGYHQDREGKGWVSEPEDVAADEAMMRVTGIRLTHYQHGQPIHDLADRDGLVLWDEIPL
jgi:D-alanyl-D-alanine carboxypeptidase